MKKILLAFLLCTLFWNISFIYGDSSNSDIIIIPRASWGANSEYNNLQGDIWKQILENRAQQKSNITAEKLKEIREKNTQINNYLNENFLDQFISSEKVLYNKNTGEKYAWPLTYTDYVDSIIVHHTHSEYKDSIEGIKDIHRYHSVNRQWGDIGYNYIIGYDGEIFEGREGGDYVVSAHSKYNNMGSIGIAVMGNYESEGINEKQYTSLEKLIQTLTQKYGIDLNKKRYYHMDCSREKCNDFYIETYLDSVLAGHRDTGHTSCPGEKLYQQIQSIRENNLEFTRGFIPIKRGDTNSDQKNSSNFTSSEIQKILSLLQKYSLEEKDIILERISILLQDTSKSEEYKNKLKIIKLAVLISIN